MNRYFIYKICKEYNLNPNKFILEYDSGNNYIISNLNKSFIYGNNKVLDGEYWFMKDLLRNKIIKQTSKLTKIE